MLALDAPDSAVGMGKAVARVDQIDRGESSRRVLLRNFLQAVVRMPPGQAVKFN
jgi:hypothetical protein